jgi:hypothetical protein
MEISQSHSLKNIFHNTNKITANINFVTLNNTEYYQITYIYDNNEIPTRESSDLKFINNELILKNELTKKMIDYLFMDDSDLCEITGTKTPKDYKKSIVLSLTNFID